MRTLNQSCLLLLTVSGGLLACQETDLPIGKRDLGTGGHSGSAIAANPSSAGGSSEPRPDSGAGTAATAGGGAAGAAGGIPGGTNQIGRETAGNGVSNPGPVSGGAGGAGGTGGAAGVAGTPMAGGGGVVLPAACGDLNSGNSEARIRYASSEATISEGCRPEVQMRTCENGTFSAWTGQFTAETCTTRESCQGSGARSISNACGLNGRGALEQNCVGEKWVDTTRCTDPDVCKDGAARNEDCGILGSGIRPINCNAGQWVRGACSAPEALQVSTGTHHTCALLNSGEFKCWGDSREIRTPAAEARYTQAITADYYGCGLDAQGLLSCWGYLSVAAPPPANVRFKKIGQNAGCAHGLDTDGHVRHWACAEQLPIEEGVFVDYSAGEGWFCGVTPEGVAQCNARYTILRGVQSGQLSTDQGKFIEAAAGCGLREDGSVACINDLHRLPADSYRHLIPIQVSSRIYLCAVNQQGKLGCDADLPFLSALPKDGGIRELAVGEQHACVLRTSGSVDCHVWYPTLAGPELSQVQFTTIAAGGGSLCGLRPTGFPLCVGTLAAQAAPTVPLKQIAVGYAGACGLTASGEIHCWGAAGYDVLPKAYQGAHFSEVAVGDRYFGGVLSDTDRAGSILMWVPGSTNAADVWVSGSESASTKLAMGGDGYCAERSNGLTYCYFAGYDTMNPLGIVPVSLAAVASQSKACALNANGKPLCTSGVTALLQTETLTQLVLNANAPNHFDGGMDFCGLRPDQSVICAGENVSGRVNAPADARFVQLAMGDGFACGLTEEGRTRCWGFYDFGQAAVPLN